MVDAQRQPGVPRHPAAVDPLAGSGHRIHSLQIVYRAEVLDGELRDEIGNSTDHAEWVPFDRLDELALVELVAWARHAVGR